MSEEIKEKKLNTFSVIIPTCERPYATIRAVNSVLDQTYPYYEIILVEDGSQQEVKDKLDKFVKEVNDPRLKIVHHEQRMQRLVARNTGYRNATKEYICNLDSDDAYLSTYLDSMNWAINEYPNFQCFHFGAIIVGLMGHRVRESFDLKDDDLKDEEVSNRFRSGYVGQGSFVYKREIHDKIGYFPEIGHHDKFADWAKERCPYFMEWAGPMSKDGGKPLGNNWGDDYWLFYSITRRYRSKMVPFLHYIQYVRRSGFTAQDSDMLLNRPNVAIP